MPDTDSLCDVVVAGGGAAGVGVLARNVDVREAQKLLQRAGVRL